MRVLAHGLLSSTLLLSACDDGGSTGAGGSTATASSGSTTSSSNASSSSTAGGESSTSVSSGSSMQPNPFECVGMEEFPPPTAAMATLQGAVTNAVAGGYIDGVEVKACDPADVLCQTPIATTVSADMKNASIVVPTPAPYGFEGYFRTMGGGQMVTDHWFNPFFTDTDNALYMPTVNPSEAAAAAQLGGVALDPSRGQFIVAITDCSMHPYGTAVAHAVFTIDNQDPQTKIVYVGPNGLPKPALTETEMSGAAVLFNVPTGPVTIRASFAGMEVASRTVPSKTSTLTHVILAPRPKGT